jgi:cbb3-type cytochrome oxidase maturation protein
MSVLFIVLPLAILIAMAAVFAFAWMVRSGQMDDLDSPALRMLHDDAPTPPVSDADPEDPS